MNHFSQGLDLNHLSIGQWLQKGSSRETSKGKTHKEPQAQRHRLSNDRSYPTEMFKPAQLNIDRTAINRLTQTQRNFKQCSQTSRRDLQDDNFNSIQSDLQRKLNKLSKVLGTTELDISNSLNVTGLIKKGSDTKTVVIKQKCDDRLESQMQSIEWKEKYHTKCEELNSVKDKIIQRDKVLEGKAKRLKQQENDIKILADQLEQRARLLNQERKEFHHAQLEFASQREQLQEQIKSLKLFEESLIQRERELQEKMTFFNKRQEELQIETQRFTDIEKQMDERQKVVEQYSKSLEERERDVFTKEIELERKGQEFLTQINILKQHEEMLKSLEQNLTAKLQTLANIQEKLFHKMLTLDQNVDTRSLLVRDDFHKQQLQAEVDHYLLDMGNLKQSRTLLYSKEEVSLDNFEKYLYK